MSTAIDVPILNLAPVLFIRLILIPVVVGTVSTTLIVVGAVNATFRCLGPTTLLQIRANQTFIFLHGTQKITH